MKIVVWVMSSLLLCACDDGGDDNRHLDAGNNGSGDGGSGGQLCANPKPLNAAAVYTDVSVPAADLLEGTATAYEWTVTSDSPCDSVLRANEATLYSVSGETTNQVTFRPTLPGKYVVSLKATTASGPVDVCGTVDVSAPQGGLRVEMCTDGTSNTDVDLHVHRPGSTAAWFSATDDCFYNNCIAQTNGRVNWGLADSQLAACQKSPNGSLYTTRGNCPNPRMDSDTLDFREFENTTIDNPPQGMAMRVMAHYYGGSGTSIHPVVAIYCGSTRKAVFGTAPDQVQGFNKPGGLGAGSMWRVADVTMNGNDCTVTPLHPPSMPTGYHVTADDTSY